MKPIVGVFVAAFIAGFIGGALGVAAGIFSLSHTGRGYAEFRFPSDFGDVNAPYVSGGTIRELKPGESVQIQVFGSGGTGTGAKP